MYMIFLLEYFGEMFISTEEWIYTWCLYCHVKNDLICRICWVKSLKFHVASLNMCCTIFRHVYYWWLLIHLTKFLIVSITVSSSLLTDCLIWKWYKIYLIVYSSICIFDKKFVVSFVAKNLGLVSSSF